MSEAEYRAKLDYKLCELGISYSARSTIIEAKIADCEDRAYYHSRSVEEEFERELEGMEAEDSHETMKRLISIMRNNKI